MIFGFESLLGVVRKNSEENIKNVVFCNWYGTTILALFIYLIINELLFAVLKNFPIAIYYIAISILTFCLILYLSSRRAVIGCGKNNFIFLKLALIRLKATEVKEIPYEKIKSIDLKKFLIFYFLKISFINNTGKFQKLKITFSSFVFGLNNSDYKKSFKEVVNKLTEYQKILDKGDF